MKPASQRRTEKMNEKMVSNNNYSSSSSSSNNNNNNNNNNNRKNSSSSECISEESKDQVQQQQQLHELGVSDFLFGSTVGEGSFGCVCYAKRKRCSIAKEEEEEYAIKIMDKFQIIKEKKVQAVMLEKNILLLHANSNFIIRLHGAFHDTQHLFLLFDLCWGTLSDIIPFTTSNNNNTNASLANAYMFYYLGQTLRALEYLHSIGIVHCDLKPDNILLTRHGQLRLSDFGAAIDIRNNRSQQQHQEQQPMVGSVEYVSPEMIRGESIITPSTDLWALGCILCLFLNGTTPFQDSNLFFVIKRIIQYANCSSNKDRYHLAFPTTNNSNNDTATTSHNNEIIVLCSDDEHTTNNHGQELVALLLHPNPKQRIGAMDQMVVGEPLIYSSIRSHKFFNKPEWNWDDLLTTDPPYRPPQPNWFLHGRNITCSTDGAAATTTTSYLMDGATEFDQWLLECH